jgi:uncharacterized protein YodC (DUF2158 family)
MKTGDVVKLKTGGTAMTVESVDGGWAQCSWFDGGELNRKVFQTSLLEPADAAPTDPDQRVKVRWKNAHHGFGAGVGDVQTIPHAAAEKQIAAGNAELVDKPVPAPAPPKPADPPPVQAPAPAPEPTDETDEGRPAPTPDHVPARRRKS